MAKAKETPADLFMQFKTLDGQTDATNGELLEERSYPTGLSIRAPLLWLIHKVSFYFDIPTMMVVPDEHLVQIALSTIPGLTVFPLPGDNGLIELAEFVIGHGAVGNEGGFTMQMPMEYNFLPPVPIAAPNLSVYCRQAPDTATLRANKQQVRIGFTTSPIDTEAYAEIAEVWAAG